MMQLQLLSMPVPSPKEAAAGGEGQKILGNAGKGGSSNGNTEKGGNSNGKAETCGGNAEDGSSNGNSATYVGVYASSY